MNRKWNLIILLLGSLLTILSFVIESNDLFLVSVLGTFLILLGGNPLDEPF